MNPIHEIQVTLPELALIAGTRAATGAGLALLLGHRLHEDQRRAIQVWVRVAGRVRC